MIRLFILIGCCGILFAPVVASASDVLGGVRTASVAGGMAAAEEAFPLPQPLTDKDVSLYKKIFTVQESGQWKTADKLIGQLDSRILMGHVLAQRYLHPTKYRSRYKELKAWMDEYADHPDARRLYKLGLRRKPRNWKMPKAPESVSYGPVVATEKSAKAPAKRRSKAQRRKARSYLRQVRRFLRNGWTKAAKNLIRNADFKRVTSAVEYDQARARLGAGYLNDGRDQWALEWAGAAAKRSGKYVSKSHWIAGLASWRMGRHLDAARHFEAITEGTENSSWMLSAASFWAARAHLVGRNPKAVNRWLGEAAAHPRTFYGLMARRLLGLPLQFSWKMPPLEREALARLGEMDDGKRALGLIQVGQQRRAERELRLLAGRDNNGLARGILALASRTDMPALAVRLDAQLYPNGGGFDGAAYPLPGWQFEDGFSIDKALVFALIRQESRFNPKAKSWAGASGLMQLMPRTAGFVARDRRFHRHASKRRTLFEPETNLRLGQKYIHMLLADAKINNDLFFMVTAWNGGPGNLNKWRRKINHMNDPLFFIESLPSRETRIFIERVLANLWIYRNRLGQPSPSLDTIAAGRWPVYTALDKESVEVAEHGENRR
ncbi:MAG: lytic transglycosylase domain-containing protein [Rhodospirillales bacterium]|nr:lytic transglycosylase domain-containing protein [Rhodospirillales bacterium]